MDLRPLLEKQLLFYYDGRFPWEKEGGVGKEKSCNWVYA